MKYFYAGGGVCHIRDVIDFNRFGQSAELSDEMARVAILGGCVIIPADSPEAKAFSETELAKFSSFGSHEYAPSDFAEKKREAAIVYAALADKYREEVANG